MAKKLDWFISQEGYAFTRGNFIRFVPLRYRIELWSSGGDIHLRHIPLWNPVTISELTREGWQPPEEFKLFSKRHITQNKVTAQLEELLPPSSIYEAQDAALTPINVLLDSGAIPPGELAIDLGTGDGSKFKHILGRAPHRRAIGLDKREVALPKSIEYRKADLDHPELLPVAEASADLVCMIDATAGIMNSITGFEPALRIVRPGGHLFYVDRNTSNEYFDRNAQRLGIHVIQSFEMPVKIEEHAHISAGQMVDVLIEGSGPLLKRFSLSELEAQVLRQRLIAGAPPPKTVLPYELPYFCALVQKV